MKKTVLLLFLTCILSSCSINDDDEVRNVIYQMVPVESVVVPDAFVQGEEYSIVMIYKLPTECHVFYGTEFEIDESTSYFGILTAFTERAGECELIELEPKEASFKFTATREDLYTFKFWQGEDENGNAIYLTKEIPVVSE